MTSSSRSLPTTREKILTLKSKDGEYFDIKTSEAVQSVMLKNMINEEDDLSTPSSSMANNIPSSVSVPHVRVNQGLVPLEPVHSRTLAVVTAYLKRHGNPRLSEEEKNSYDLEEIVRKPLVELFHIYLAADYMEIKDLFELASNTIANKIKNFSLKKFREVFNVEKDSAPEKTHESKTEAEESKEKN